MASSESYLCSACIESADLDGLRGSYVYIYAESDAEIYFEYVCEIKRSVCEIVGSASKRAASGGFFSFTSAAGLAVSGSIKKSSERGCPAKTHPQKGRARKIVSHKRVFILPPFARRLCLLYKPPCENFSFA